MKKYKDFINENIAEDPYGEEIWENESLFLTFIRNDYNMNLEDITYVDFEYRELENLDGIKKLPKLKMLFCLHNHLTNIDEVRFCKDLEVLDCHGNQITELDFIGKLQELVELSCDENNLQNIDGIKNLEKLKQINFSNNNFDEEYEKELKNYCLKNNIVYWDDELKKWIPRAINPFYPDEK